MDLRLGVRLGRWRVGWCVGHRRSQGGACWGPRGVRRNGGGAGNMVPRAARWDAGPSKPHLHQRKGTGTAAATPLDGPRRVELGQTPAGPGRPHTACRGSTCAGGIRSTYVHGRHPPVGPRRPEPRGLGGRLVQPMVVVGVHHVHRVHVRQGRRGAAPVHEHVSPGRRRRRRRRSSAAIRRPCQQGDA